MEFVKEIKRIGDNPNTSSAYHVALTGTENYISWIGVTMASIMEHNKECNFVFHILVDSTSTDDLDKLQNFANQWGISLVLYYMNDEVLAQYSKFDRYFIDGRYIPTLVYRFVIPEVVAWDIKRVLYLDGDIVCNGDITEFMDLNLEGNIVGVSEDLKGSEYAERTHVAKYFNAGIILIDADKWRHENLTDQFLQKMKHESEIHPELPCADQDILNTYLDNKALFVSHKYNMPYRLVQPSFFKARIENEDAMQASLVHFIGAIKPWTTYNQSVPIVKVWAHAKDNSPWKDVPLHEPTSQKAIHQAARDARRRRCYGEMVVWYLKFIKSKMDGTRTVGY